MSRKIRTHTAHGRPSKSRNEQSEKDSLPERPQTSLGFDRELSHVSDILKRRSKVKKNVISDKPSETFAFNPVTSKHRVQPLKDVLAKFTKYEEEWEKRRYPSTSQKRPQSSNVSRYEKPKELSLQQTKLKHSPASRSTNERLNKNVRTKSANIRGKSLTNGNSTPQCWITKADISKSPEEIYQQSQIIKDGRRGSNNHLDATSNRSKLDAHSDNSKYSLQAKYITKKFNKPASLATVVEGEDIERYIEDDKSDLINPVSVYPTPNEIYRRADDDEDYDTELEDDFPAPVTEEYDPSGRKVYTESCKSQEVVPVTYIYNRLGDKEIVMRHHGLGPDGTKPLANALMKNTCVEVLDLTDNDLQSGGTFFVSLMLYENFYITDLDLSENSLHADGGISLAKVLLSNTSLKRLILRGNHLTDRAAKVFAEVFKENRTLLQLDLSYNDIGESGGLFLGAGLALNYGLRTLNLSWNGIRNKGAVSIAAAIKTNDSLRCLNLAWNGLAFVGALAFTRHLKKNDTLKELDISNNRISPKGAVRLSTAIAVNTCLQIFKIGLNPIGDEGVEAILNAAKKNLNIKFLGLEDITVSPKVHEEIIQLERTRDITILTGGKTGHTQEKPPLSGIEILIQFIQDNRLRLKDLFFQFDKDQSGDISRDEFKAGLKETGITMSEKQLDALIESIDIDNSNTIEYSEILYGREAVMKERRFQKKVAIRTEQREKESIKLPKLKGFED